MQSYIIGRVRIFLLDVGKLQAISQQKDRYVTYIPYKVSCPVIE